MIVYFAPLPVILLAYLLARPGAMGSLLMGIVYAALAIAICYGLYITIPPWWLR
jgi:hypothetical protein